MLCCLRFNQFIFSKLPVKAPSLFSYLFIYLFSLSYTGGLIYWASTDVIFIEQIVTLVLTLHLAVT